MERQAEATEGNKIKADEAGEAAHFHGWRIERGRIGWMSEGWIMGADGRQGLLAIGK